MFGYQCTNCDRFWASMAGPEQKYHIITLLCPLCVAVSVPLCHTITLDKACARERAEIAAKRKAQDVVYREKAIH